MDMYKELTLVQDEAVRVHRELHAFAQRVEECLRARKGLRALQTFLESPVDLPEIVPDVYQQLGLDQPGWYRPRFELLTEGAVREHCTTRFWPWGPPMCKEMYIQKMGDALARYKRLESIEPLERYGQEQEAVLLLAQPTTRTIQIKAGWKTLSDRLYHNLVLSIHGHFLERLGDFFYVNAERFADCIARQPGFVVWDRMEVESGIHQEFLHAARQYSSMPFSSSPRSTQRKPKWAKDEGLLFLGGEVIRKVRNPTKARNIVRVLDAFEEDGWPHRIDSPLDRNDQETRDNIVKSLNRGLKRIRFRADGSGEGFLWESSSDKDR